MSEEKTEELIELLDIAHLEFQTLLNDVDLEKVVYEDSGWRVRDIIAHVTTWDQETVRSIHAYSSGSEYKITDLDDDEVDYNQRTVLERHNLSDKQVVDEWDRVYEDLRRAIQELPVELVSGDMLYPWGSERGSITTLVGYMLEHLEEHGNDISKILKG